MVQLFRRVIFTHTGIFYLTTSEEKDKQNGIRKRRFGRNKTDDS